MQAARPAAEFKADHSSCCPVWRNLRRRSAERICARRRCAHESGSTRGARRGLSASANSASVVDFDRIVAFAARRCGAARRACRASRAARRVARISCARRPACCSVAAGIVAKAWLEA